MRASERAAAIERRRSATLTVARVCEEYLVERVEKSQAKKGSIEVRRMFATILGEMAEQPAATLTRSQAFDLLSTHLHIQVQAAKLRAEMGGTAWDYSLDAGPPA